MTSQANLPHWPTVWGGVSDSSNTEECLKETLRLREVKAKVPNRSKTKAIARLYSRAVPLSMWERAELCGFQGRREWAAGGSRGQAGKGKAGDSPGAPELSFPEAQVLPE